MTAVAGSSGPPALRVRDATLRVGAARLLDGVTIDVSAGRLLALVGPNGAGKSSLLSLLSGDVAPTAGEVEIAGRPARAYRAKDLARVRSVLLQSNSVSFAFTATDVVAMGRAPWPDAGDDDARIAAAMAHTDVSHLADRVFSSLSGGERARVSLARVLAQDTQIVLLDEPTAALDLRHQEDVLHIARGLAERGRAVVVVLHDLSLAAAYADEVAMLSEGRLCAHGAAAEVLTAERIESVYRTPVRLLPDPATGRPVVLPRRK